MKKVFKIGTIFMVVLCVVLFMFNGCTDCEDNSSDFVLTESDYTPGPLDWYNLIDSDYLDESYNVREDQIKYDALLKACKTGKATKYIKVPNPNYEGLMICSYATTALNHDYPETELLDYETMYDDDVREIIPKNIDEYNQKMDEIDSIVNELVDSVEKESSIVNKYRLIHDWIVENVEYDFYFCDVLDKTIFEQTEEENEYYLNSNANNIYGAIVEKKAVCSGISDAFKYICNKCDLEAMSVEGTATEGHAWNVVSIYGTYFLIDCTWDIETESGYGTRLVLSEDNSYTLKSREKYSYFLINNLNAGGRTIYEEGIVELLNKKNPLKWDFKENHAESQNGITIEIPDDYNFINRNDGCISYALTPEAISRMLEEKRVDDFRLSLNGEIEHVIYLAASSRLESIVDYSPETKTCYSNMSSTMLVIMNYNGEEYTIKIFVSGM